MVYNIHLRFCCINLLQPRYLDFGAECCQDHARPQSCKAMLNTACRIKEGRKKRKRAKNNGVKPDERIKNKVRAQPRKQVTHSACLALGSSFDLRGFWHLLNALANSPLVKNAQRFAHNVNRSGNHYHTTFASQLAC